MGNPAPEAQLKALAGDLGPVKLNWCADFEFRVSRSSTCLQCDPTGCERCRKFLRAASFQCGIAVFWHTHMESACIQVFLELCWRCSGSVKFVVGYLRSCYDVNDVVGWLWLMVSALALRCSRGSVKSAVRLALPCMCF